MKDAKQGETYLSSEGVGVLAGLLIIGGILLGLTGSRIFTVLLFELAGAAMAGWAWISRKAPPARPEPTKAIRASRSSRALPLEPPAPEPPAPEPPAPEPPAETAERPIAPVLPASAARLMKALEARSAEGAIGQTVRVETLIETGDSPITVHLVVTGDGPPRDLWFGRDGEALPVEVIIGRMPPEGVPGVSISSKTVSARQARLSQHERTFLIENLSKTNATRVGGRALQDGERRALADGDLIEMGPVSIRYHLE